MWHWAGNSVSDSQTNVRVCVCVCVALHRCLTRTLCLSVLRRKPVIAAVNGAAIGFGLTIVMACDFVVASDRAIFGFPEVKLGTPAAQGSVRTPRMLPWQVMAATYSTRLLSVPPPETAATDLQWHCSLHTVWAQGLLLRIAKCRPGLSQRSLDRVVGGNVGPLLRRVS